VAIRHANDPKRLRRLCEQGHALRAVAIDGIVGHVQALDGDARERSAHHLQPMRVKTRVAQAHHFHALESLPAPAGCRGLPTETAQGNELDLGNSQRNAGQVQNFRRLGNDARQIETTEKRQGGVELVQGAVVVPARLAGEGAATSQIKFFEAKTGPSVG
jgi:hypothetical protein